MKVEYVCQITLDQRDVRLAAVNGGMIVDHPVAPVQTVLRVSREVVESLILEKEAALSEGGRKFRVSAAEPV